MAAPISVNSLFIPPLKSSRRMAIVVLAVAASLLAASGTPGPHSSPKAVVLLVAQRFHRDWASRDERDAKTIATGWVMGQTFVDPLDLRRDPLPTRCDAQIAESDVSSKPAVLVCEPARIPGFYVTAYDLQQKAPGEFLVVNVELLVQCSKPLVNGLCPTAS